MTISSTTNRVSYQGNGTTAALAVSFPFLATTDLVVVETVVATGAQTTKALTTDYTVTGSPDASGAYPNGGSVVPVAAIASTLKWTIYRDPPATQTQIAVDNDPLPASLINSGLDKLTMLAQRTRDLVTRACRLSDGDISGASATLPTPASSKLLGWASDGLSIVNYVIADLSSSIVTSFSGTLLALADAGSWRTALGVGTVNHGQCRLVKSGSNIVLQPYNGSGLVINGGTQAIPSAGVALAPTGLTATTLYYIYAFMSGTTMTLEASTTTHATDTTTGVEIKSGDATRTLVGMARPVTGPAWSDTGALRYVASWFNRLTKASVGAVTSATTAATAATDLATGAHAAFLSWAEEAVTLTISGTGSNSSAGQWSGASNGLDGSANGPTAEGHSSSANNLVPLTAISLTNVTEGAHYNTPMVLCSGGSGAYTLTAFATTRA